MVGVARRVAEHGGGMRSSVFDAAAQVAAIAHLPLPVVRPSLASRARLTAAARQGEIGGDLGSAADPGAAAAVAASHQVPDLALFSRNDLPNMRSAAREKHQPPLGVESINEHTWRRSTTSTLRWRNRCVNGQSSEPESRPRTAGMLSKQLGAPDT